MVLDLCRVVLLTAILYSLYRMAFVFVVQIKQDTVDAFSESLHVFCTLTGVYNFLLTKINHWKQYDWDTVEMPLIPTLDFVTTEFARADSAMLYTFGNYTEDRYTIEFIVHKKILSS